MHQNKYINVNGLKIAYKDAGDFYETIILLPGMSLSVGYHSLITELSKNMRVIAPDLPGSITSEYDHSKYRSTLNSYSDFTIDFINELGLEQTYLFGNSMGGTISFYVASKIPNKIPKIIVRSPLFDRNQLPWSYKSEFMLNLYKVLIKSPQIRQQFKSMYYKNYYHYVGKGLLDNSLKDCDVLNEEVLEELLFDIARTKLSEEMLSSIKSDVLILWSKKDSLLKCGWARKLQKIIPNSTLVISQDYYHTISSVDPVYLSNEILNFIRK